MNNNLLARYSLKWNPFAPEVPTEALCKSREVEHFCRRIESLAREGGFALITGEPGSGKSVTLRLLVQHLSNLRDIKVGILTRPHSSLADFYRELGDLFGLPLSPHNRWAGTKVLRECWQAHIESVLFRPILLIDEAQLAQPVVLNELRLLSSSRLDSRILLTTVLAGDRRLLDNLRTDDLLPLASRLRVRLLLERASENQLQEVLLHLLDQAGNPSLMTSELMATLCEHALGNYRALMTMAGEILATGADRDLPRLDEQLFLELVTPTAAATPKAKRHR
jgi:general secretion pathway protein A